MRTRVIGIGSPHGDDQAGWLIAKRLSARSNLPAEVLTVGQPIELLEYLGGCERLIIVDACRTDALPGSVFRLDWSGARIASPCRASTHGVGVDDALRLAQQLDRLPKKVVLYAVEADDTQRNVDVSESVTASLDIVERRLLDEIISPIHADGVTT